jgi:hypothetical protein
MSQHQRNQHHRALRTWLRASLAAALLSCVLPCCGRDALAASSLVERLGDGVYEVRDDAGQWPGDMSRGITHQSHATYQAKKVLDLSDLPDGVWQQACEVRLSAFFMVRDYSGHAGRTTNGLDEAFEVIVNAKVHRFPTNCGAPVYAEGKAPAIAWYDLALPKADFTKGRNEIILHKAASDKNDDYVYLGIDESQKRGNSYVAFDGKTWTQDKLTVPGGNGEYMVRLLVLTKPTAFTARWQPGQATRLTDPAQMILYAGARHSTETPDGLRLPPGESARMEWHPRALDLLTPLRVTIEGVGHVQFAWLDDSGKRVLAVKGNTPLTQSWPANRTLQPSGLAIEASGGPLMLKNVTLEAGAALRPLPKQIDLCPRIAACPGKGTVRPPARTIEGEGKVVVLESGSTAENAGLRCRFEAGDRLRLTSLYNHNTQCEMLRDPAQASLFLVEVGGRRYAGHRDFRCTRVRTNEAHGFAAELTLAEPPLKATLTASVDGEGLRLGLSLTPDGPRAMDFKLAFPHLAGLAVSEQPADDYYFYPWGGGIIADVPAHIRRGYGDHEALYQVMDLFSPARGGGLYLRLDDAEGWHKTLALRKHIPGRAETNAQRLSVKTTDEFQWTTSSLAPVAGTGFACEYLRRTRQPGEAFAPAVAVLAAHPGDWHAAMQAYADWAHRVWKFRPFPSRLKSVHNMIAAGWGQGFLFQNGKYRTDIIQPPLPGVGRTQTDCIELMSWWEWSPLGPWSTPFDKLKDVLTPGQLKAWQGYFVQDPVTGRTMWNNQPGDYDGYNQRFGGLPVFRQAVQTYRDRGALVTLYTDPFRLDDASQTGRAFGKRWGVVGADGKQTTAYEVWNPCHDLPEVRQWVADAMKRVMRETGADGLRLDEYGHAGWVCFSTEHKHTFAERGVSQWQKAVAEATRLVRAGMDEVSPGSVLTTEHPGYDYLLQFLEGCITYDLTVLDSPLRPLECNLQRFYFPECKAYELDHRGADPECRKKFWNAVESFGRYYPLPMYVILRENEDVYQGRACAPLIATPGPAQHIYVNRFGSGSKMLYHVYNATGHTFDGPALTVPLEPGEHVFDLLQCREVAANEAGRPAGAEVRMYLQRAEVACLARLPMRLGVRRSEETLRVTATFPGGVPRGGKLVVANLSGERLLTQDAKPGPNDVALGALGSAAKAACVKLLCDDMLVDVATIPER